MSNVDLLVTFFFRLKADLYCLHNSSYFTDNLQDAYKYLVIYMSLLLGA